MVLVVAQRDASKFPLKWNHLFQGCPHSIWFIRTIRLKSSLKKGLKKITPIIGEFKNKFLIPPTTGEKEQYTYWF